MIHLCSTHERLLATVQTKVDFEGNKCSRQIFRLRIRVAPIVSDEVRSNVNMTLKSSIK